MSSSNLTPSILDLASKIQSNAKTVHDHLQSNSLPPLSLASDAFPFFPGTGPKGVDTFEQPGKEVEDARRDLRQTCETLLQLITTPAEHVFWNLACLQHTSACVQYVYHFRIAEAVPAQGDISYADLANKAGVNEGQCTRIIRMLITYNCFHEPRPGYVGHTAGSMLFQVPSMRDGIGYAVEEGLPAASKLIAAAEKFGGSEERNEAPWNLAQGTDQTIFEFMEKNPVRMQRYFGAMDNISSREVYTIDYVARGYDWKALGKGTVIDVGGNIGHASFSIMKVAPELNFIVQDLENVIDAVKKRNKENDKLTYQVHDFFQPQPVTNADVYLLRFILHDYSDKYAGKIVANLIPAMGPKSKIVVMDAIMPAPNTLPKFEERQIRLIDIDLMLNYNAVERDIEGWKRLFAKVDGRLKLLQTTTPPGSALSIMEWGLESS